MNNHSSIPSRILIAFASGALVAVFFLPAWRIDLFAPQYPEGLSLYIWINKLSGDIDIINGLNHYIGMKHISAEMFPEFRYLPWVVGFFMVLGMSAAITGSRKLLLVYVILTIAGAAFVPYDLYRWGYAYGHELDPHAAIQVPGLSYQPPVFGHKRLLNFDAYSFPDVAGWIVAGAGALAALVWLADWYRHHRATGKSKRNLLPKTSVAALAGLMLFSCNTSPEPFIAGRDACYTCKMGMADLRFGGEVITRKGKVYKFDDMGCLIQFLDTRALAPDEIRQTVAMNYREPNTFLDVSGAWFLVSAETKSPMNSNIAGFSSQEQAEETRNNHAGNLYTWAELLRKTN